MPRLSLKITENEPLADGARTFEVTILSDHGRKGDPMPLCFIDYSMAPIYRELSGEASVGALFKAANDIVTETRRVVELSWINHQKPLDAPKS